MSKIANPGKFKRTLVTIVCAATVASGAGLAANASGIDNTSYEVVGDTLIIKGTGKMESYDPEHGVLAPWYQDGWKITNVVIEDGVTGIGDFAFYQLHNLNSVEVPATLTTIGKSAFSECFALNSFGYGNNERDTCVLGENVAYVGKDAFFGCSQMRDVYLYASDLSDYHFDGPAEAVNGRYDFCNPAATTMHVAKSFENGVTEEDGEAIYQWAKGVGDKRPVVYDINTASQDKGNKNDDNKGDDQQQMLTDEEIQAAKDSAASMAAGAGEVADAKAKTIATEDAIEAQRGALAEADADAQKAAEELAAAEKAYEEALEASKKAAQEQKLAELEAAKQEAAEQEAAKQNEIAKGADAARKSAASMAAGSGMIADVRTKTTATEDAVEAKRGAEADAIEAAKNIAKQEALEVHNKAEEVRAAAKAAKEASVKAAEAREAMRGTYAEADAKAAAEASQKWNDEQKAAQEAAQKQADEVSAAATAARKQAQIAAAAIGAARDASIKAQAAAEALRGTYYQVDSEAAAEALAKYNKEQEASKKTNRRDDQAPPIDIFNDDED